MKFIRTCSRLAHHRFRSALAEAGGDRSRFRHRAFYIALFLAFFFSSAFVQRASGASTIYGGGPFYSGGYSVMNTLRASGYTTVMLWCIHVNESNGNLIFNDQLVVANGVYVGNASWPAQLATLKTPPTSVQRIAISVGSWGVNDFLSIQTLMNNYGTNTDSILYRNFQALKNATGAEAIDFDDETLYDVATAVKFGRMLSSIGYKISLCPYTNPSFWQNVYNQLGPGIVDTVYLQCYAGGAGNNPATWNNYFGGLKVQPGMWCKHGSGCSQGSSAAEVQAQMLAWKNSTGISGGFMWLYDDMLACSNGGTAADYARAINVASDPLQVSPGAGFGAVAAYNQRVIPAYTQFTLGNPSAAPLAWSLINTSAWLTASSTSGTIPAGGSAVVTVNLNGTAVLNLPPALYAATVLLSNRNSGVSYGREFSLNTAIMNWPVTLSGFNASLVVPNTATPANPGATPFDIPNGYCFYQAGLSGSGRGLPLNRAFASLADGQTAFQLGSYGVNNALLLGYNNPKSGTLTLSAPQALNSLAVLATSANGGGHGTLVINFADGSKSPVFDCNAQDWFYTTTNVAIQGFGRIRLGTGFAIEDNGDFNPNLYQTTIDLAALGLIEPVSSITFSNPVNAGAQQTTAILGISGMPVSVPVSPPSTLIAVPGTNGTVRLVWSRSVGAVSYNLKRALTSGGPYVPVVNLAGTNWTDSALENGLRYYYVVSAVGTTGESTNSLQVSVMPGSYQAWTLAGGPVAYYPLDDPAGSPIARDLAGDNTGTHFGNCILGMVGPWGAGFDTPHRATRYDGSSAYTVIPRTIGSGSFSIVVWIQTTASGGSPNWYNGRGIVDGEVGGATTDFGLSLVGTKAGFGIGSPDTTLISNRAINDGPWHQIVATRDSSSGEMKLYIDGVADNVRSGPTGSRAAPPNLRLGSLQTGGGLLLANLSEVALYNRVLTATEVSKLYRAAGGLFYGVSLTNSWNGNNVVLTWRGNGKLLESTNLSGPWTTNSASSPALVSPAAPRKFYRLQID